MSVWSRLAAAVLATGIWVLVEWAFGFKDMSHTYVGGAIFLSWFIASGLSDA